MTGRFHPKRIGISRLQMAVMGPFFMFVVILAATWAGGEYVATQRDGDRIAQQYTDAIEHSFAASITRETAMILAILNTVAEDPALRTSYAAGDRAALYARAAPLFQRLKDNNRITHFYVTGADRVNFLRVHQPERHGDRIDRVIQVRAEQSGRTAAGIELGPLGTLTLRVVVPWRDGDRLLGYLEMGEEVERLFSAMREEFGVHPLVFIPKSRLNRADWESGMAMLARAARWDEIDDWVLTLGDEVPKVIIDRFVAGQPGPLAVDGRRFTWLRTTVVDADGGRAAVVGLVMDITQAHDDRVAFAWRMALTAALGTILVSGLFWVILRRVDSRLEAADAELRTTAGRLRLVLETAAEGVVCVDDAGRVMFANRAAALMLGWPSAETMQGMACDECLGHRMADGSVCHGDDCGIRRTVADRTVRRICDEVFAGQKEMPLPVEYVVSPILVSGQVSGAVIVFHDISARKALEDEIRRSNAELERFAYVASHDLRQPLRMIASYLALIERRYSEQLDVEGMEFIAFARDGAKRLDRMIRDLLDYSRIGRTGAADEDVDLNLCLQRALDTLSPVIAEARAEVQFTHDLPCVTGSASEMERLFQNLIGNAVKFHPEGRRPAIWVDYRRADDEHRITVRDNGIGIPPDQIDQLFGIFQRLVPRQEFEGNGIGLAACKKIVERMNGRISVSSEPGLGSSFTVILPVRTGARMP